MSEDPQPPQYRHSFKDIVSDIPRSITLSAMRKENKILLLISEDDGTYKEFYVPENSENILQYKWGDTLKFCHLYATFDDIGIKPDTRSLIKNQFRDIRSWMYAHPHPDTRAMSLGEYLETLEGEEKERAYKILNRVMPSVKKERSDF